MALIDIAVRNAKPQPKPYRLADGEGLYLLVQPTAQFFCLRFTGFRPKRRLVDAQR